MNIRHIALPIILAASTLLAACSNPITSSKVAAPQPGAPTAPAASATGEVSRGASTGVTGFAAAPAPAPGQAAQVNPTGSALPALPTINRMVIKNGALSISVDDTEATLSQVDQLVQSIQGVITNQTIRTDNGSVFANLVIQVAPENFESTLARLRDLRSKGSQVLNDTVNSQDVTEQYVDLQAQFNNLQRTRDAYQGLLTKATSVADIITLTRELNNVQTQMDQIQGRQNLLSRQSAVSTINLSLAPIGAPSPSRPQPLPNPAQAAQQAWQALLTGLQGLAVVLIWLGVLAPIPAAIVLAGWIIYRRLNTPHPA